MRILTFKKSNGSYPPYASVIPSNWWVFVLCCLADFWCKVVTSNILYCKLSQLSLFPASQIVIIFFYIHAPIHLFLIFRLTALVVKVLSMVAERQAAASGQQGRTARVVPEEEIRHSVRYLLTVQESDGTYRETQRMLHRGVLVTFTAFISKHPYIYCI